MANPPSVSNPLVVDERLPSLPVLLGPQAGPLLSGALAEAGTTVESAQARFVLYRPGRDVTVSYAATLRYSTGKTRRTTVVATERDRDLPEGALPVEAAGTTVGVWAWPFDPWLTGLQAANDAKYVRELLDAYGAPPGRLKLRTMSYWPGRRAVMRATIPSGKLRFDAGRAQLGRAPDTKLLFVKVLRPGAVQPLYRMHAMLGRTLPVAGSPGGSDEHGLLVLEALPGATLGDWLVRDASMAPPGERILELLSALRSFAVEGEPRRTTQQRLKNHITVLKAVVPGESDALDRIAEAYGDEVPQSLTTVHGDFHESQLLVEPGRISGLIDVDDVGPGQLVDDLSHLAGRVLAMSRYSTGDRGAIRGYAEHLLQVFETVVDGRELRRRVTGTLVGRATLPFRAQQPDWPEETARRLRVAEDWLERCRRDGVLG